MNSLMFLKVSGTVERFAILDICKASLQCELFHPELGMKTETVLSLPGNTDRKNHRETILITAYLANSSYS